MKLRSPYRGRRFVLVKDLLLVGEGFYEVAYVASLERTYVLV